MSKLMRTLLIGFFLSATFAHAAVTVQIKGQKAKNIYKHLTGPAVQDDGAAGHIYRHGKSVICRYTNADMDDHNGNPVSRQSPDRYLCVTKFNKNGLASPSQNF